MDKAKIGRGPQSLGELRSRTMRMCGSMTLPEIEKCLVKLTSGGDPLIEMIPARAGQKENRYVQPLSGECVLESWITTPASGSGGLPDNVPRAG
jgi:uncharacterized protein YceH (UPF0502 family)